jgi:hypothetical protein
MEFEDSLLKGSVKLTTSEENGFLVLKLQHSYTDVKLCKSININFHDLKIVRKYEPLVKWITKICVRSHTISSRTI